jgi:gluconolactonase
MDIPNIGDFYELVPENTEVEKLGTGFTFTEGPVWNGAGRFLLFSLENSSDLGRLTANGRLLMI